ncbi:two-component system, chemotaxis family, response regulator CheB [Paenibacillus algorifonticola]|uniref:Two-component system, chemotaxis family, response regulator CheB n=1 Tax=Paenibacillus algorifonticola TaxID=684063 RepID=A0A1I2E7F2_9BACL|nr:hypothetical protein [Paenibacillus algorifonticola]SFE88421.1 two-component system, chemotaxis family, response regulator CheB [Paenibacillus algorifonticola]
MALQRGAVDFVAKPSGELSADIYKVKSELCEKIKNATGAPIVDRGTVDFVLPIEQIGRKLLADTRGKI